MAKLVESSIYAFEDYKAYLSQVLGRGLRSQLAGAIGIQSAFVSQVLKQKVHFSLEHAIKISKFLGHSESEAHYFMLMLEFARAGSEDLRKYFKQQMEEIHRKRLQVDRRLEVQQVLSRENQLIYYSSWYYAAVHVCLSIPELQAKSPLAAYLGLSPARVADCLEFLCRSGLAVEKEGRFEIGPTRVHLPADSPHFSKHQVNWRVRSIQALEQLSREKTLHYCGAITLSKADVEKIRKVLLEAIERTEAIYRPSKEEVAYAINMDFFPLGEK